MLRAAGKPVVLAVNKIDDQASEYLAAEFWKLGLGEPYSISAMHGRGVGDLLDVALDKLKQAEKTSGYLTPSGLRRVALVGRPNVASRLCSISWRAKNVPWSTILAGTTRDPRRRNRQHRWRGLAVHRHGRHQATPAQAHRRGILFLSAHAGRHRAL